MKTHLEFIPQDLLGKLSCESGHPYVDYDGTHQYAECGKTGEVWLVVDEPFINDDPAHWGEVGHEFVTYEFCRPHGNLALLDMREFGGLVDA